MDDLKGLVQPRRVVTRQGEIVTLTLFGPDGAPVVVHPMSALRALELADDLLATARRALKASAGDGESGA